MRVITNNPVLVGSTRVEPNDMYLNLDAKKAGSMAKGGKSVDSNQRRADGKVWDKTKGAWVKAQDSGLLSSIGTMFGLNQAPAYQETYPTTDPYPPAKPGMSPGLKTGLIIGGLALAAVGIYFLVKKNKSGK